MRGCYLVTQHHQGLTTLYCLMYLHLGYVMCYMPAQVNITMHLSKQSDVALVSHSEGHLIDHPKGDHYSKENSLVFTLSLLDNAHPCCPSSKVPNLILTRNYQYFINLVYLLMQCSIFSAMSKIISQATIKSPSSS